MKKTIRIKSVSLTCLYLISLLSIQSAMAISDSNKWQLVKNDQGIQVFVTESDHSDIVKAKSSIEVNNSLSSVQALLDNVDTRHKWIPYLKKSQLIKYESDNESLEYSLFAAPWPASDRDFVYRLRLTSSSESRKVYKMSSEVSELMPVSSDAIRAVLFESIYTLTVIDENRTRIELTFHADLKGWIPTWIVNMVQQALPFKTLKNLKSELIKQENKSVKF